MRRTNGRATGGARERGLLPRPGLGAWLSLGSIFGFLLLALAGTGGLTGSRSGSEIGERGIDDLDRKIGQMLLFGFDGSSAGDARLVPFLREIHEGLVGGAVLLGRNVGSRQRLEGLVGALVAAQPPLPLLVAIDQEGGRVQRIGPRQGFADYPSAEEVARTKDPGAARTLYAGMAAELARIGINLNLGPVADLATNDANPVIARLGRSFGSDAASVIAYARAFMEAHAEAGLLVALKHFPGHGSSRSDTHDGPADVTTTWREAELEPFRALAGGPAPPIVMVGHVAHARLTGDAALPASLSRAAIEGTLRGELGFAGVVMTDDLGMAAVRDRFGLEELIVRAVNAGNDILLFAEGEATSPRFRARVRRLLRAAVERGTIPLARIEASLARIRALKARIGARAIAASG